MHRGIKFASIFLLGGCLFLAGCPDKSTTEQSDGKTDEVDPALVMLEKYTGTYDKNEAGVVVTINLNLSKVVDQETEEGQSVVELFDAINTLVDLEKVAFSGPGIDDVCVLKLTNLKKVKTAWFKNANITTNSLKMLGETMQDLTDLSINRCMKLDGSSISAIAKGMPKLKILDLQSNAFKTFDLRNLSNMPELQQLDLRQCTELDGDVLKHVAGIKNLQVLKLRGVYRDSSIENLAGHSALKALHLQDAVVTDDFLDSLLEIPTLIDLTMFRLLDISNDGLKKL